MLLHLFAAQRLAVYVCIMWTHTLAHTTTLVNDFIGSTRVRTVLYDTHYYVLICMHAMYILYLQIIWYSACSCGCCYYNNNCYCYYYYYSSSHCQHTCMAPIQHIHVLISMYVAASTN